MDRGYVDFERLYAFTLASAFFVVRTKRNVLLQRRYSHPVDKSTGVTLGSDSDSGYSRIGRGVPGYPSPRSATSTPITGKRLVFLTNNFTPARSDHRANLQEALGGGIIFSFGSSSTYGSRHIYGTSENAVKTPDMDRGEHIRLGSPSSANDSVWRPPFTKSYRFSA